VTTEELKTVQRLLLGAKRIVDDEIATREKEQQRAGAGVTLKLGTQ
jgi:hypothetical protein